MNTYKPPSVHWAGLIPDRSGRSKSTNFRYHRVLAPNHRWRGEVIPARCGRAPKKVANAEEKPELSAMLVQFYQV